ncbi:H-NS histone family protein [uncultured Tateyamaria sp.]|uniref:H-NS histone family protein n=1 Tax=uncultured Tateyamaria sp. TaxID=455651 RepID=UPI0026311252|nr:H-NS histone family protein [uncultured Tateyamaria sp.]
MINIEWDKLSVAEIEQIQKEAEQAMKVAKAREMRAALAAAEKAAAEFGFSLSELTSQRTGKAAKSPPKYAHPKNPGKTWTGKGRQPNWVKEYLRAGKPLEDLAI